MKVGFIGVGLMGSGMARRLLAAGHELTVYNRTAQRAQPLVEAGARLVETPAALSALDIVVSMVADDAAIEAVALGAQGLAAHLRPGALHVSMSSISVAASERLAEAHAAAGQNYLAAPVFGRPDAAAAGKLWIAAAGPADQIARAQPLFDAMGQKTFVLGERPAAANLAKLSGNFLIAAAMESIGEALALLEKGQVDRTLFLELITSSIFGCIVYKNYGTSINERRFSPAGFAAPLGQKDIRLTLAAADTLGVAMPVASVLRDRFHTLLAGGGRDLDWSAIGGLARRDAGLG